MLHALFPVHKNTPTRPGISWGCRRATQCGPAAARSKVPFGELAKRVGNGAGDSQYDRSVSNRVPSEAIADGVHSAIGGPARHTSLAAGAARLFRKPKWKLELQLRALLEIRYRDRQERDGLLTRMLREHRAHQFFGDLGKDCRRRNRRVERYGTAKRAQVGEANPDRHRPAGPGIGPKPAANPVRKMAQRRSENALFSRLAAER